jgi:hypothetical protein
MRYTALLLIGCLLSSCATIRHGRNEVISVDSNPSGATATINCGGGVSVSGSTPVRLTIPRKADGCRVDVEKNGMKTQKIQLDRGFNSAYWMNFIPASGVTLAIIAAFSDNNGSMTTANALYYIGLAGAAGFIVDRITGAMYDHDPSVIKVTLQPEH